MARNAKNFNCAQCSQGYHCDADGEWPNSRGPAGYDKFEIHGVIKSRTCLLPMITAESVAIRRMHAHYKNGFLPLPGGLLSQPNYYLQAMELCDTL